jgi:hypothetical protein
MGPEEIAAEKRGLVGEEIGRRAPARFSTERIEHKSAADGRI